MPIEPSTTPSEMAASDEERRRLERWHAPHRVRQRIRERRESVLGDAVLGAVDGAITTFAVVAGSLGAGFSSMVVIVLGFASLAADGLSMAVSNYLRAKSEHDRVEQARREEERHIRLVPEEQQDEVRHIFAEKGFGGETLDRIVETITQNRRLWVDTVVSEGFGLPLHLTSPWRAGLATFLAFLAVGCVPLAPFVMPGLSAERAFVASVTITAVAFLAIGMIKGRVLGESIWRAGIETLVTGGAAAVLAYGAGHALRRLVME